VARTGIAGQCRQVRGVTPGPHEIQRVVEGTPFDAPRLLSAQHPAGRVMHGIGDEPRRQAALHLTAPAVLQRGPRALEGSAGVSEVVRNDLIRIDATLAPGELAGGGSSHLAGRCHGLGGGADIGNGGIHQRNAAARWPRPGMSSFR
jgi:hypothetical protein